ncbi:MAG: hypothetical protein HC906_08135 [Bacteroidales bacterium]|nr:hypothetical protein [Bacteroidales bacterium]
MKNSNGNSLFLYMVYAIYFFCGLAQSFETVFIPEFKEYFNLNYEQAMYVNIGKNAPIILSVLLGFIVYSVGYKNFLSIALFYTPQVPFSLFTV